MIWTGLSKYRDVGLLILRVGVGIAFMAHGWPKIQAGPPMWHGIGQAMGNLGIHFFPTFWGFMAAMAEFGGGLLLAAGLFSRPVCLIMAFNMFVAMLFHLNSPVPEMRAFNTGYGHAFELLCVLVGLFFMGPGKYSADREGA